MGHYTATVTVSAAAVQRVLEDNPRSSKVDAIASAAVREWRSYEAAYDDNERVSSPQIVASMPVERAINEIEDMVAHNNRKTIIIPLWNKDDYTLTSRQKKVSLSSEEWEQYRVNPYEFFHSYLPQPKAGTVITSFASSSERWDSWEFKSKVTTASTGKGALITEYYLSVGDSRISYPTQAEARAAAVALIKEPRNNFLTEIEVFARKVRSSGPALATVTKEIQRATKELTINEATLTKKTSAPQEYLVAFDYHS